MKKCLIFLMFACLLAVSCANQGNYEGYYITYDEVAVRESPAADAPVVLKLICKNRPRSYKQAKGDVPCAFVADTTDQTAQSSSASARLRQTGAYFPLQEKRVRRQWACAS